MLDERWKRIGDVKPDDLVEGSLELHWAVQYIAAMGQTFVEERGDDSHRAMTWDREKRMFIGEPFAGAYPFRVALRPADLTLLLIDRTDEALGTFELAGRTRAEGFEWLAIGMATYLGGSPPRIERPDWTMPDHPVRSDEPFSTGNDAERRTLSALYDTAAETIERLIGDRDDAGTIRCWPHHFDIAALITLEEDDSGDAKKTVGVGMAPTGGGYDSWYWYVSPWPYPEESELPDIDRGTWETVGWTGAVLTGKEIVDIPPAERAEAVRLFLVEAMEASAVALRGA